MPHDKPTQSGREVGWFDRGSNLCSQSSHSANPVSEPLTRREHKVCGVTPDSSAAPN
jgi:hypothetical protein